MDGKDDGFEKGVKRLHKIVSLLEEGELPLEKGLALFSEGAALAKSCRARLEAAKVSVTLAGADGPAPFEDAGSDDRARPAGGDGDDG
ncbi:MAG: exodeoxyribonuclease VII small subunit [Desulfovibrionaceae bacterium]|nr:exodeoxyribonuclease VII small subunit [Desulfovibrionaceae bacterium]MBF0514112.1 exodeoxyribonuclease VII small subunit [Desulfovibrionaceae bacterium]